MGQYVVLRSQADSGIGPIRHGVAGRGSPSGRELAPPSLQIARETLDRNEVADLARDPAVLSVSRTMPTALIRPVSAWEEPQPPQLRPDKTQQTWGVRAVGAHTSRATGAGVKVAVLDTGVDAGHPAFAGVELEQQDFTSGGDGDRHGHGTHCAATFFGRDLGDGARIGVARGVTQAFIGKVLDDNGRGDTHMMFAGLQAAVARKARVISISLSLDFPGLVARWVADGIPVALATSRALEAYRDNLRALDKLVASSNALAAFDGGCLIFAAAGNESQANGQPAFRVGASLPAATEGVVAVGAVADGEGGYTVAPFSNTYPQLVAPGVGVLSAMARGRAVTMDGTSMACPHVAGVAALWWEWETGPGAPSLVSHLVRAKLLATARTDLLRSDVAPADRGAGLVQAP